MPSMPPLPDWLAGYPRFRGTYGLAPADALALCSMCTLVTLGRGDVAFRRGEEPDAVYVVRSGHVAVRFSDRTDEGPIAGVAGVGVPLGARALVHGEARIATAYALDDVELIRLGRLDFELVRRERPGVERFLVEAMAMQVQFLTARADDLSEGAAEVRVLRRLLELAYTFGPEVPVLVPLAQDDVAALAGVTRSTVNRVLRAAAQQRWVGIGWRRLLVLDPAAIRAAVMSGSGEEPLGDQPGGRSPTPA